MQATSYLNRLGLDHTADERAIKRAYARELKQIDMEADADGFQTLRHAYEIALQWVKHKPAPVSFAPAVTVPVLPVAVPEAAIHTRAAAPMASAPARDADTGENPVQQAQTVFDAFVAICSDMAAQGNARDLLLWRKHLQQCASDNRLLNLSARAHFEFFIARLLANGWRPGHEGLFVAARQLFGWENDRRRLMEFGQLGAWLNQAIEECEIFMQQPSGDVSGQADALARVREDAAPSRRELMNHVPHLRKLVARFPAWTAVIASSERIEQWMEMEQEIPAWRRRLRLGLVRPEAGAATETGSGGWWKFVVAMIAVRAFMALFGSSSSSTAHQPPPLNPPRIEQPSEPATTRAMDAEAAYKRAAGSLYMPPGTRQLDPQASRDQSDPALLPTPKRRALNDAEMKAISDRVQFHGPHTRPGSYQVEFIVELDEHGAIARLTTKTPSGLPLLDKHVEDAIRASAPFSTDIRRQFGLFYTWSRAPAREQTSASTAGKSAAAE